VLGARLKGEIDFQKCVICIEYFPGFTLHIFYIFMCFYPVCAKIVLKQNFVFTKRVIKICLLKLFMTCIVLELLILVEGFFKKKLVSNEPGSTYCALLLITSPPFKCSLWKKYLKRKRMLPYILELWIKYSIHQNVNKNLNREIWVEWKLQRAPLS
jgi:hypothetical protein